MLKNKNMQEKIVESQGKVDNSLLDDLKKGLSVVENKERAINSKKMIDENKLKENRTRLIKQLFESMQDMGGDPSSLESINEFLSKLSEQDPDLLKLFEFGFSVLQEETGASQEGQANSQMSGQANSQTQAPSPSLTNNFDNLRNQALNRA